MFKYLIPIGILVSIATADIFPLLIVLLMFFSYRLGRQYYDVREVIAQINSLYEETNICDRMKGCGDCEDCILNEIERIVKRGGR